jgi:hypothetical protein
MKYIYNINIYFIYIYASLYEPIHKLSRVESSRACFVYYSSQDLCSRSTSFNIRVEPELSLCKPSPSLLAKRFAHLIPLVVCGWRSLNGQSLHDRHHQCCVSSEVGFDRIVSVMYGSVQFLGH